MAQDELVSLREWQGRKPVLTTMELCKLLKADRKAHRVRPLCVTTFRDVLRGRVRQVPAALKVHGLELRALREVLGGRVRQVLAKSEVRVIHTRPLHKVISRRDRKDNTK